MELEVTWKRTLKVWWSLAWRHLLAGVAAFVVGLIVGAIMGAALGALGVPEATIRLVGAPISFAIGTVFSLVPVKLVLGKDFGEFRLALLSRTPGYGQT